MSEGHYERYTAPVAATYGCEVCGAAVWSTPAHNRWHEALEEAFRARDKSLNEAFDAVMEGFKARDTEFGRLVDVLCGRKPRKPHRIGKPMTDEERAELNAILETLDVPKVEE